MKILMKWPPTHSGKRSNNFESIDRIVRSDTELDDYFDSCLRRDSKGRLTNDFGDGINQYLCQWHRDGS